MGPLLVAAIIVIVSVLALLAFRWFERYRYTDGWRKGDVRGAAFSFLLWFGGLFGHRVPPPPQAKVEFVSGTNASLPKQAADEEK